MHPVQLPVQVQPAQQALKAGGGTVFLRGGVLGHAGLAGIAAPLEHGQLVLGEQRLQQLLFSELCPGRDILDLFGVQAPGRQPVMLCQPLAHQQFQHAVAHKGQRQGWLTAASVLARKFENDNPVLIYLPESAFNTDTFIEDVKKALEHTSNLVVCVSEGINDGNGTFICELASDVGVDTFGHKMLTGSGKYLENLVKEKLGVKVRSIELNVNQRCSSSMISATDQEEAIQAGISGVHFALDGITGKMIAFHRTEGADYSINYVPEDVNLICNQEKTVPPEWITGNGSDIGQAFIDYALPLIQGIVNVPEENGLPKFAYRK